MLVSNVDVSVLVSNVDVIWFRNFDPKQLSQDVAFQVYSVWSSQQFQQSLADGKVCGSTATGARCTSFAMPNSTTSPTARRFQARAQCLEAIFNFGFYFVKASAAAINLQAELAKAVLTRSTKDQPSFGSTPGFLGRPVCHDNNEFNLLATSQQQRLFKRLFVDDVQVDVHCEDNFEPLAPSERYPLANQYTQYEHIVAAESADIRIWNPQQAPVSIQYILGNVDLREVVGVHLTLQNTKAPLMLEMLDSNNNVLWSARSLPSQWKNPSRNYLSYCWWMTPSNSYDDAVDEFEKAAKVVAALGRHLIVPRLPCKFAPQAEFVDKKQDWCLPFMFAQYQPTLL